MGLGPELWGWDLGYGAGTPKIPMVRGAGTPAMGLRPELWGWDPRDPHSRGCWAGTRAVGLG